RGAALQRGRQDHAVQLRDRRLSTLIGHHPLLRRGHHPLSTLRAHPQGLAPHLPDFSVVSRPDGTRQRLSRLLWRFPWTVLAAAAAPQRRADAFGRSLDPGGASDLGQGAARGGARAWTTASARNRVGTGGGAAFRSVRRAGSRAVANRAARADRNPDLP